MLLLLLTDVYWSVNSTVSYISLCIELAPSYMDYKHTWTRNIQVKLSYSQSLLHVLLGSGINLILTTTFCLIYG